MLFSVCLSALVAISLRTVSAHGGFGPWDGDDWNSPFIGQVGGGRGLIGSGVGLGLGSGGLGIGSSMYYKGGHHGGRSHWGGKGYWGGKGGYIGRGMSGLGNIASITGVGSLGGLGPMGGLSGLGQLGGISGSGLLGGNFGSRGSLGYHPWYPKGFPGNRHRGKGFMYGTY